MLLFTKGQMENTIIKGMLPKGGTLTKGVGRQCVRSLPMLVRYKHRAFGRSDAIYFGWPLSMKIYLRGCMGP